MNTLLKICLRCPIKTSDELKKLVREYGENQSAVIRRLISEAYNKIERDKTNNIS